MVKKYECLKNPPKEVVVQRGLELIEKIELAFKKTETKIGHLKSRLYMDCRCAIINPNYPEVTNACKQCYYRQELEEIEKELKTLLQQLKEND